LRRPLGGGLFFAFATVPRAGPDDPATLGTRSTIFAAAPPPASPNPPVFVLALLV